MFKVENLKFQKKSKLKNVRKSKRNENRKEQKKAAENGKTKIKTSKT
jgi:hypothetical protein